MGNTWLPIAERIRSGDYSDLIDPLDYHIIGSIPDFDTNMGGMYQLGDTVKKVTERINEKAGMEVLSSGTCSARMRMLVMGGLAREVHMVGRKSSRAYQKTERGEEVYEAWLQRQGA